MQGETSLDQILTKVKKAAPAGFAVALHINFTSPRLLFQAYPVVWRQLYSERGYLMSDPTVIWGFENDGVVNWSDLTELDQGGVLTAAAEHGMKHGITIAIDAATRSICSFSRSDRPFTDAEIAELERMANQLHTTTRSVQQVPPAQKAALEDLDILVQDSAG